MDLATLNEVSELRKKPVKPLIDHYEGEVIKVTKLKAVICRQDQRRAVSLENDEYINFLPKRLTDFFTDENIEKFNKNPRPLQRKGLVKVNNFKPAVDCAFIEEDDVVM
ncbi:hypothetical protein ILUMI_15608, partial [Ignelater luminosus]